MAPKNLRPIRNSTNEHARIQFGVRRKAIAISQSSCWISTKPFATVYFIQPISNTSHPRYELRANR